jgi:hypothetical protein
MFDRQYQESFGPSPACTAWSHRRTDAVEARPEFEQLDEERERSSRQSLRSLQQRICELLIENQQLRMSLLDLATNRNAVDVEQ